MIAFLPTIHILGFSLTGFGEPSSFGQILQGNLREKGWAGDVREISYGGLSINALSGLVHGASAGMRSGDVVGLELATSFFSLQNYKLKDALPLVFWIAKHHIDRDMRVFFLNLFREDLDDEDCVVLAIRAVAGYFNIPILDLKEPFRRDKGDPSTGTTDGVHPTPEARQRIAREIENFLMETREFAHVRKGSAGPTYSYVDLVPLLADCERFHYSARGKSIDAAVALADQTFEIGLPEKMLVTGFCFLYGPETGFISLTVGDSEPLVLITYDEHSYYRRIGFWPVNREGDRFSLHVLPKTRDITLVRVSALPAGTRRDFPCGLVVRDRGGDLPKELMIA